MTTVHLLTEPTVPPKPLFKPYDTLTAERLNSEFLFLEGIGRAATTAIRGPRSGLLWYSDAPTREPIKRRNSTWTIEKGTRLLLQSGAIVQFESNLEQNLLAADASKATVIFKRSPPVPDGEPERIHCELTAGHTPVDDDEVRNALGWLLLSSSVQTPCEVVHVHLSATEQGVEVRNRLINELQSLSPEAQADGGLSPQSMVHRAMFRRELQVARDRLGSGGDYATVDEVVAIVQQAVSATAGLAFETTPESTLSSHSPHGITVWWGNVKRAIERHLNTIATLHEPPNQAPPWGDVQLQGQRLRHNDWKFTLPPAPEDQQRQLWLVVAGQGADQIPYRWSGTDEQGAYQPLGANPEQHGGNYGFRFPDGAMGVGQLFVAHDDNWGGIPQVFIRNEP